MESFISEIDTYIIKLGLTDSMLLDKPLARDGPTHAIGSDQAHQLRKRPRHQTRFHDGPFLSAKNQRNFPGEKTRLRFTGLRCTAYPDS